MPCTGQFILKCEGELKMVLDMKGTWGVLHFLEELFEVFFLRAEKVSGSTKEEGGEVSNSAKTETDVLCVCVCGGGGPWEGTGVMARRGGGTSQFNCLFASCGAAWPTGEGERGRKRVGRWYLNVVLSEIEMGQIDGIFPGENLDPKPRTLPHPRLAKKDGPGSV